MFDPVVVAQVAATLLNAVKPVDRTPHHIAGAIDDAYELLTRAADRIRQVNEASGANLLPEERSERIEQVRVATGYGTDIVRDALRDTDWVVTAAIDLLAQYKAQEVKPFIDHLASELKR